MVLEEARAKLRQDDDASTSTRGRQEVRVGRQGGVLGSHRPNSEGIPPHAGKGEGCADQSVSAL